LAEELGELTSRVLADEFGVSARDAHHLIRNLATEGSLEPTERTRRGAQGRPAVVYRFARPPRQGLRSPGARPISAKTINNSLTVLRVALEHAREDGLISRNPAASSRGGRERLKVAEEHREMDFLRMREIPRYLEACEDHYRPLAELLIATGLRISEALDLTWQDLDLDARAAHVTSSRKGRSHGGEGSGSTKATADARSISARGSSRCCATCVPAGRRRAV
jgi:integrase